MFGAGGMIGRLFVRIDADAAQYDATLKDIEKNTQKLATNLNRIGRRLTIGVTAPLALMATKAVQSFAEFDKAMTETSAVLGGFSKNTRKRMEDVAKSLSTRTIHAPQDLAQAYVTLARAGNTSTEALTRLPIIAKLSQAGVTDLHKTVELMTTSFRALGNSAKETGTDIGDFTRLANLLLDASIASEAEVTDLAQAITSKLGQALRLQNRSMTEGIALSATFARMGLRGAVAGERMNIFLRDLNKAQIRAAPAWAELNLRTEEAGGKNIALSTIIAALEKRLDGYSSKAKFAALKTLGFEYRSIQATASLLGMSDTLRDFEERFAKTGDVIEDVATKQLEAFSNAMQVLQNQITVAAIDLGGSLAPVIENLASLVATLAGVFSSLPAILQSVVAGIGLLAAVVGPLLLLVGQLVVTFLSVKVLWGKLTIVSDSLTENIQLLNTQLAANAAAATTAAAANINLAESMTNASIAAAGLNKRGPGGTFKKTILPIERAAAAAEAFSNSLRFKGFAGGRQLAKMKKSIQEVMEFNPNLLRGAGGITAGVLSGKKLGTFNRNTKMITLDLAKIAKSGRSVSQVLVHELTHALQMLEGRLPNKLAITAAELKVIEREARRGEAMFKLWSKGADRAANAGLGLTHVGMDLVAMEKYHKTVITDSIMQFERSSSAFKMHEKAYQGYLRTLPTGIALTGKQSNMVKSYKDQLRLLRGEMLGATKAMAASKALLGGGMLAPSAGVATGASLGMLGSQGTSAGVKILAAYRKGAITAGEAAAMYASQAGLATKATSRWGFASKALGKVVGGLTTIIAGLLGFLTSPMGLLLVFTAIAAAAVYGAARLINWATGMDKAGEAAREAAKDFEKAHEAMKDIGQTRFDDFMGSKASDKDLKKQLKMLEKERAGISGRNASDKAAQGHTIGIGDQLFGTRGSNRAKFGGIEQFLAFGEADAAMKAYNKSLDDNIAKDEEALEINMKQQQAIRDQLKERQKLRQEIEIGLKTKFAEMAQDIALSNPLLSEMGRKLLEIKMEATKLAAEFGNVPGAAKTFEAMLRKIESNKVATNLGEMFKSLGDELEILNAGSDELEETLANAQTLRPFLKQIEDLEAAGENANHLREAMVRIAQQMNAVQKAKAFNKLKDEAEDFQKSIRTPQSIFDDQVTSYKKMLDAQLISAQEFSKGVDDEAEKMRKALKLDVKINMPDTSTFGSGDHIRKMQEQIFGMTPDAADKAAQQAKMGAGIGLPATPAAQVAGNSRATQMAINAAHLADPTRDAARAASAEKMAPALAAKEAMEQAAIQKMDAFKQQNAQARMELEDAAVRRMEMFKDERAAARAMQEEAAIKKMDEFIRARDAKTNDKDSIPSKLDKLIELNQLIVNKEPIVTESLNIRGG